MISKFEVPELIDAELHQITACLQHHNSTMHMYKSVESLTAYTKNAVLDHNFNLSRKCFSLAERLYNNGDRVIKSAIENTFIYSFSSFMPCNKVEKMILKSIIPGNLYDVYIKQLMQSGC